MENKLCFLFSLRGAPSLTRARSGGRGKEGSGGGGGEARGLVGGDSRALQTRCCLFAHRASGRVFADFSFFSRGLTRTAWRQAKVLLPC